MRNLLTIAIIALTLIACDKDKETTETPVAGDMAGMEMDATVEAGTDMTDMGMDDMAVDAGAEGGVEETTDMAVEGGSADMGGSEG